MKSFHIFLLSLYLLAIPAQGQQLYFVYFTDKPDCVFDSREYFDEKALERRKKNGLSEWDDEDLPVYQAYVDAVQSRVDSLRYTLRWLNAVSVRANETQIGLITQLPFVKEVEAFTQYGQTASYSYSDTSNQRLDTLLSLCRNLMNLDVLEENGLTGKGVRVAIFDTGFKEADTHPAFAHIRSENRIFKTRDFYSGQDKVFHHDYHGLSVMSCVGGMYGGRQLGAAKDATFLLARTEHKSKEKAIEEDHWIAAAEWADQNGADMINSSLTYTDKRYTYADMDGKTSPVSRAAAIAVRKGMHVICSIGNDGDRKWRYMGAPADVEEVITVGGSLPMLPKRIRFASLGPNAVGVLKPNISAPGLVVSAKKNGQFGENTGTSFSSPLVAGIVACLIQQNPDSSRASIARMLFQSGHYYPYYDYELGYGVVNASRIVDVESGKEAIPSFKPIFRNDTVFVAFNPEMVNDSLNHPDGRILYYHLADSTGKLQAAYEIPIVNKTKYYYFLRRAESQGMLRIWFAGYLWVGKMEKMLDEN